MTTVALNTNALVTAMKSLNKATGTAVDAARNAAEVLVAAMDKEAPLLAESERLIAMAKLVVKDAKIKLKDDRNVYAYLRNALLVAMVPETPIEVAPASGKNGPVLKPAALCRDTAASTRKAAKQIREIYSEKEDGRKDNGRKSSANEKLAKQVASAIQDDATFLALLRKELAGIGYSVTLARSSVKRPAKKAAPVKLVAAG